MHESKIPMRARDAFTGCHPLVSLAFFVCAIVFCMVLRHPAFQVVGALVAAVYYLSLHGVSGWRVLAAFAGVFAVVSLANPLFNTMGDTVLFLYFGGREFTWEALAFGMSTAGMLVTMLLWIACYSAVMTSDKFTYLFGGLAPALSLVLTMALRLVPSFMRKTDEIATARAGVNLHDGEAGSLRSNCKEALTIVGVLTAWAFEGAVETADSMRCRGYGLPGRTRFSNYRFDARDFLLLALIVSLAVFVLSGLVSGVMTVEYYPQIVLANTSLYTWATLAAYGVLLGIPVVLNAGEVLTWRAFLSRI